MFPHDSDSTPAERKSSVRPAPESNTPSRRDFLTLLSGATALTATPLGALTGALTPISDVDNPLAHYPDRGWEHIYHDQYGHDRSFTWICAPNDTHMCRMRAFVRNGVMVRSEQNYDSQRVGDLYGNKTTQAWNPRGCPKGYTFQRRVYGPFRLKGPVLRKGWKQWADDGFPSLSDSPELRTKYKFDDRGNDEFVRVGWEQVSDYVAGGLLAISDTYNGDDGRRRLEADGYEPEMFQHWKGAGTRTMKIGSNLPLHGLVGKFGLFRFANMTALLDHHTRGVKADDALGCREWTEYTWRGDQAPGQPFVHGLQTSDMDMSDLRFSKLTIQVGKNLIENKMADSHWLTELIERGGKIVCISPDYSAPSAKADYWIGCRPGLSDTSVLLGVTKILIDRDWIDRDYVLRFTDFPLLVRTDNLRRLRPEDLIPGYQNKDLRGGPSYEKQALTDEQRERIGDFTVYDTERKRVVAISRDDVGQNANLHAALEGTFQVELVDGERVEVMPVLEMYRRHLADYDLETVAEISGADGELVERLARDIWETTQAGGPVSIHHGEGTNHYFHGTLHNRACWLPMMLTGNIGHHGAGVFTWAGNYKGALFQGSPWSGPGAGAYSHEDPFHPVLDEDEKITHHHLRKTVKGEDVAFWGHGDRPLIVETPQGRKVFTGDTHMPSPTKLMWYSNANLINQAKWIYELIVNVFPKIDMIVDQQVEFTASAEYSDVVLPANSWVEFEDLEIGGSCSNPFLQVWGGDGIAPVHDSRDDAEIFAGVGRALAKRTGDRRFADYWRYITEKKAGVYIQRVLDSCTTTTSSKGSYQLDKLIAGEYGEEPGAALMLFRTYPRVPFVEQIQDSDPFYTDTGRLCAYCDLPEAIEYGENLIVHREGTEATPYLPNVIVSSSPYVRPDDYGIPLDEMDPDLRTVRNVKMPWKEVKNTKNPLWEQGYSFFCSTPKSRHTTHSSWSTVDWHWLWSTDFGDPYRHDKRDPGTGDRQIQMNPIAARDLGLEVGDYVWVDANPADRPFRGAKPDDPRTTAFRCMVRVKTNPSLPYEMTIMKHTGWIATERTVKGHQAREDGKAISETTGYQSNYRYGSHQSITRNWLMPMHQTDTLFHKKTGAVGYVFGFAIDNHGVNTVPKETLVRITKAEAGGEGGEGSWYGAHTGRSPSDPDDQMRRYLAGGLTRVES
ncbi:MAG: nitrate oxidoreductase subunit alpha [Planctomycetes bacterium]|jgi:nitrate reductase alpha subunit|nr:nitrate oxidoreductase subunit alpha [Planctomycetota bacterium]